MTFILILSLFLTPYEIAFDYPDEADLQKYHPIHKVMDSMIDFIFFLDVIITFYVAYLTDDFEIVDDRKMIANHYLNSWFTVDILSCIPYGALGKALLNKTD